MIDPKISYLQYYGSIDLPKLFYLFVSIFKFIMEHIALSTLVVGTLSLIYLGVLHYQKQKNFFTSLVLDLNKISENSDSYKEVILQSIQRAKHNENIEIFKDILENENNLENEFEDYFKGDYPVRDQKGIEELKNKIKKDKTISKKIHKFGMINIIKSNIFFLDEKTKKLKYIFSYSPLIPQYLPHNIDYNFYSKNIDFRYPFIILSESTSGLKREILKLKSHIDVLTFQINMLNNPIFIPHIRMLDWDKQKESKLTLIYLSFWYGYYYQMCTNILTLDRHIYSTYKELKKFIKPLKEDKKNIIFITRRDLSKD